MDFSFKMQPSQRPVLGEAMQQAFQVLQMPAIELREWITTHLEQNPALEYEECLGEKEEKESEEAEELNFQHSGFEVLDDLDDLFKGSLFPENKNHLKAETAAKISFYDYLSLEIERAFSTEEELALAKEISSHLDEKGFISISFEELSKGKEMEKLSQVLEKLQRIEPPGIFAFDLRDALLLQLKIRDKKNSLSYQIIEKGFQELLYQKMHKLKELLGCSIKEIQRAIKEEIVPLSLNPLSIFDLKERNSIIPDILIIQNEEAWKVEIKEDILPAFKLSPFYLNILEEKILDKEETSLIRKNITAAKWVFQMIDKRKTMLEKLGNLLIKLQGPFLEGKTSSIAPMNMQEAALELGVHESSIARAVSQKYIECPAGIFPLRSFFCAKLKKTTGEEVSNKEAKDLLIKMIKQEEKNTPLSDQDLSDAMQKLGLLCSRRTITKYRKTLKIATASQRKSWS